MDAVNDNCRKDTGGCRGGRIANALTSEENHGAWRFEILSSAWQLEDIKWALFPVELHEKKSIIKITAFLFMCPFTAGKKWCIQSASWQIPEGQVSAGGWRGWQLMTCMSWLNKHSNGILNFWLEGSNGETLFNEGSQRACSSPQSESYGRLRVFKLHSNCVSL